MKEYITTDGREPSLYHCRAQEGAAVVNDKETMNPESKHEILIDDCLNMREQIPANALT